MHIFTTNEHIMRTFSPALVGKAEVTTFKYESLLYILKSSVRRRKKSHTHTRSPPM